MVKPSRHGFAGRVPKTINGTLKSFRTLQDCFDFFNEIELGNIPIVQNTGTTYLQEWNSTKRGIESQIRERDTSWFGLPFPNSLEDALSRTKYLDMEEYNKIYKENIQPRIQDILKESKADLEMPVLKYNDLGLGTFDFNKASAGLIALYKYYSFKKKGLVEGFDVVTYKEKDKFKYKLKSDGSPVVLVPEFKGGYDNKDAQNALKDIEKGENVFVVLKKYGIKIGGKEAFSSTIKKSYLLKEKKPKPKNAIRLFVKMGNNQSIRHPKYKWTGYTAVGVAELLEVLGYAVNIIGVIGIENIRESAFPTRYIAINLKNFDETLDKQSLLYVTSDPSFFRIKYFEYIIKTAQYYKDYIDGQLGRSVTIEQIKDVVFNEFGKRDIMFNDKGKPTNSQFLYYMIGDVLGLDAVIANDGKTIIEDGLNSTILDIGLNVVNENKEARDKLLDI
jgi:hypothetical protein